MTTLTFIYIELNSFAIIILFIIILNISRSVRRYDMDFRIFGLLAHTNAILLLLEMVLRIINGKPGYYIRLLSISIIVLYNILNPIICMIWHDYVYYYIYGERVTIKRICLPILFPVILNVVLSISSIFTEIYFVLDDNNIYYKGRYIYALLGICLYMIIYTNIFLVKNKRSISQKEFIYFILFVIPPIISGIIQAVVPVSGLGVIWHTTALSICIIFINIQKEMMNTDYLTGINNRRCLDNYLRTIESKYELIAGIMIDIDSFKTINDNYGHVQGDQALRYTSQILKDTFSEKDFIARYGGDEFVVLMEIKDQYQLTTMVQNLSDNIARFNSEKIVPYEISLSMGYDYYTKELGISANEFIARIDHLLYLNKEKGHNTY